MRGGTSKAVIFHEKDLPEDKSLWDDIFLKVMGTPDVKQIDGMGGTVSSTSKIAIISPSDREDVDVNYSFRQVDIVIPNVDKKANCGNISSAVGPFAIDEGLVPAVEPITVVKVLNTNTNKIIEEHVRVKDGHAMVDGDEVIRGVPGTGSRIDMYFMEPAGAATGKLFPTGNRKDVFDIPDYGLIEVSIVDCSNTIVFMRAKDLGIKGTELTELNANKDVMEHIERVRCFAAKACGFVENWVRAVSVGSLHKAYPITVSIGTGAAALLPGTIVNDLVQPKEGQSIVRLGHASGVTAVDIKIDGDHVIKGGVTRTARRIMDGYVYVRE